MDYIVTIDDATKYFSNYPNTKGYPTFIKIRGIRHCFEMGLRQIRHPDRKVMGWAGLATDPALYSLVDTVAWITPVDPGPIAVFLPADTTAEMKMKIATFTREKNMFTSCENISGAMVRMLMANIEEKYQISNVSGLQGWNNDMTVMEILTQLESKYGTPDPDAVAAMETMFSKPHNPNDPPEVLYSTLEECQKIAMMNKNPWSELQVMMNDEGSRSTSKVRYLQGQGIRRMEGRSDQVVRLNEGSLPQSVYETFGKYPNQHDVGPRRILQRQSIQCTQHDRRV